MINEKQGFSNLANVLDQRIREHTTKAGNEFQTELGTIRQNLGLELDSTPGIIIPKEDYMVSRWLTFPMNNPLERTLDAGEEGATCDPQHSHPMAGYGGVHRHNVKLPSRFYPIQPGDRVLVIWANRTPVIMTVVVKMP